MSVQSGMCVSMCIPASTTMAYLRYFRRIQKEDVELCERCRVAEGRNDF